MEKLSLNRLSPEDQAKVDQLRRSLADEKKKRLAEEDPERVENLAKGIIRHEYLVDDEDLREGLFQEIMTSGNPVAKAVLYSTISLEAQLQHIWNKLGDIEDAIDYQVGVGND